MENSWCFKGAPPVLRFGWEWEDTFDETEEVTIGPTTFDAKKYYRWGFRPYYELQGYLSSLLMLERFLNWDITANLAKFRMEFFMQLIVNADFEVCGGMGWNSD